MLARALRSPPATRINLLSWQWPSGPTWRELARAAVVLRVSAAAALLAGAAALPAQETYRLIGQAAPDFALRAVAGGNVRLSEHRGEVVVLSFWSSRCTPCRSQLTALSRSFQTYKSAGLAVYGVGVDDIPRQSVEFARSAEVAFAMLLDPAKDVSRKFEVDNLPMTLLIDRGGVVRYVLRDYSEANVTLYLQELRALLNE